LARSGRNGKDGKERQGSAPGDYTEELDERAYDVVAAATEAGNSSG
jgi:hypothetical protein